MKFLIFAFYFTLTSCSFMKGPSMPDDLNTTKWAQAQDAIFAKPESETPEEPLKEWQTLRDVIHTVAPTNLTIRHDIIQWNGAKLDSIPFRKMSDIRKDAQSLIRNGYWVEGYSYFHYTKTAFDWLGMPLPEADNIQSNYRALVAPDGSIPLPEVANVYLSVPVSVQADRVVTPSYLVYRKFSPDRTQILSYLLICIDTSLEPRSNLHHHPDFGYYVYWEHGAWLRGPQPYTGWNPDALLHEQSILGVPRGPWSAPDWRLNRRIKLGSITYDSAGVQLLYRGVPIATNKEQMCIRRFTLGDTVNVQDIYTGE